MLVQRPLRRVLVHVPDLDCVVDGAGGEDLGPLGVDPKLVDAAEVGLVLVLRDCERRVIVEVNLEKTF